MRRPRRVELGALVEAGEAVAESGSPFDLGVASVWIEILGWVPLPNVLGVACEEALASRTSSVTVSSDFDLLVMNRQCWNKTYEFLLLRCLPGA